MTKVLRLAFLSVIRLAFLGVISKCLRNYVLLLFGLGGELLRVAFLFRLGGGLLRVAFLVGFSLFFATKLLTTTKAFAQNAILETTDSKQKKYWNVGVGATHLEGFGDERIEPRTVFGFSLDYTITKTLHLDLAVRVNKLYYLDFNEEEDEWDFSDPYIALRHILKGGKAIGKPAITLSYGGFLPASKNSVRNDIYGRAYVGGASTWTMFDSLVTGTFNLSGIYTFNRFTTSQNGPFDQGGRILPQYDLSTALGSAFFLGKAIGFKNEVLKSLLLSGRVSYGRTTFESFDIEPVRSTSFRNTDDYSNVALTLTVSPMKKLSVSAGYGQNEEIENLGRIDFNLFDNLTSSWNLGVRYATSF